MVFLCYLLLEKANIDINLICFDHNFGHPHINVVTFVPKKRSKKPQFFHKNIVFVEKVFDIYLLFGLSLLFSQNSCTFWTKNILFDYSGVTFAPPPPPFLKKPNFQSRAKKPGTRTNMDIILSILAKPLDRHGILLHITYLPLYV